MTSTRDIIVRNQGIDLLRIVLMFLVSLQHVLSKSNLLDYNISSSAYFYWFIDMLCCCAVNAYALISGYVYNKAKVEYIKIVNLWFQTFFYSFVISIIINALFFNQPLDLSFIIKSFMPITNNTFWYISAYFPLLFLMPFINSGLNSFDNSKLKRLFAIIIFVFSCLALFGDVWSSFGYSCLWIIILFILGNIIKRINLFENIKSYQLVLLYLFSVFISWVSFYFTKIPRMEEYISPTTLLCAIILVIIFSRIKIASKIVDMFRSLTLGVYLLQENKFFINIFYSNFLPLDINNNVVLTTLSIITKTLILMIIGFAIEFVRIKLFNLCKINKLEQLVSNLLEQLINYFDKIIDLIT